MRRQLAIILFGLLLTAPGCMVMKVTVQNPIPGMNTIAIAPFINLTQEPPEVVDGRRFALAYFAELQKTQGYQVIPVGVVEVAIMKHRLNMTKKEDVLALAKILKADAVVVGAITDYTPYYPQRIGLQVDWYSPEEWQVTDPTGGAPGGWIHHGYRGRKKPKCDPPQPKANCDPPKPKAECEPPKLDGPKLDVPKGDPVNLDPPRLDPSQPQAFSSLPVIRGQSDPLPGNLPEGAAERLPQAVGPTPALSAGTPPPMETVNAPATVPAAPAPPPEITEFDPRKPVMSYTRLFDGADADTVNRLRDYLELRGDQRSGGWQGHLQRSEDFIRFASQMMIIEMLSLHGGLAQTQIVFKWRKYQ